MTQTLGQYLLNSVLPKGYKFDFPVTAKSMAKTLTQLAKDDPVKYSEVVTQLKRLGDEFSTLEGISVGLEDIAPQHEDRDRILHPAIKKFDQAKSNDEKIKILEDTQKKLLEHTLEHKGSLTLQTKSGGRGNPVQLMKTISSPVAVTDYKGNVVPWIIKHSYSEGLSPAEAWIAGDEARVNVITGKTSVVEPGEIGKVLGATMIDQVISSSDCGAENGIIVSTADAQDLLDRFLAKDQGGFKKNTLITSQVAAELRKKLDHVVVRSPMTCVLPKGGTCQKCYGLNSKGQIPEIGSNVGVIASTAMSEPLTQMVLSAKHSTRTAKGSTNEPQGLKAVKQLIDMPQNFLHAATVSQLPGKVTSITQAPQGGWFVDVEKQQHYVPPGLDLKVALHDSVEAGDALSDGIPRPNEIVEHKGMGYGRKYLVDQIHNVYKKAGIDLDKRHLELLAKSDLNQVQIEHDPEEEFVRGDVVHFNKIRDRLTKDHKTVSLQDAAGHVLADDYLHYSVGTRVTPSVIKALEAHTKEVKVANKPPEFKVIMTPIAQTPLFNEDWLARLGHRFLKDSILEAAHYGQESDIHGYHPTPGYVFGTQFGEGESGAY